MVFSMVFAQVERCELFMILKKIVFAALLAFFCIPQISNACAVCFGDPSSPLTLGAKAGVFFLLGVVVVVLGAIVGVGIFWARRARLLEVQQILHHDSKN
jgi:hypothetical protein